MMPGETVGSEYRTYTCNDCHTKMELEILNTPAGHYLGYWCDCGPYSRETDYMTRDDAELMLLNLNPNDSRWRG
jgi:hypothetical protein